MKRRSLLAALAAAPLTRLGPARGQPAKIQVVWWHAMTGVNADEINRLARAFSESQSEVEVVPIYKGGYADTLTAAIAAWRADQAPHLVQASTTSAIRVSTSGAGPSSSTSSSPPQSG